MVLEILLKQLRDDQDIKGLKHKGFEYKIRAFADDIMFILEDPINSFPSMMKKIKDFGDLAGFYIKKNKSKIICKNVKTSNTEALAKISECEMVKRVKYFRIEITN